MKRHSRAHIRFHRDRIVAKRLKQHRRTWPETAAWREPLPGGRMEDEQWALGCHRASCGLCGGYSGRDRPREERAWRQHEDAAY